MSLLLFTAEWCGPCKMLKSQMTDEEKANITMLDPSDNMEKAGMYNVRAIPTLVDESTGKTYTGPQPILNFLRA